MNPKFFRNGIVMLVLVVGTAALLFTWISTKYAGHDHRLLANSSTDVAAGKVTEGRPAGHDADRHRQRRPDRARSSSRPS